MKNINEIKADIAKKIGEPNGFDFQVETEIDIGDFEAARSLYYELSDRYIDQFIKHEDEMDGNDYPNLTRLIERMDRAMEQALELAVINLTKRIYKKEDIITVFAWGEKHKDIFWPLIKKHLPKFYIDGDKSPIQSFLIMDVLENGFEKEPFVKFLREEKRK